MTDLRRRLDDRTHDINTRAAAMRAVCIDSQFDATTDEYISNAQERMSSISSAAHDDSMFEAMGDHTGMVASMCASAVAEYRRTFGEMPRDEQLASAHKTMESMVTLEDASGTGSQGQMMLESIKQGLSRTDGVELRAKMVGLILPTMLNTATSDAVTYIPGNHDEVEIFKIERTAGTNFGDFHHGQLIDDETVGQYSQMRQRYPFAASDLPDGEKTSHKFESARDLENTDFPIPMRKLSVGVYVNRKRVATDVMRNGSLYGEITIGGTIYKLTGSIDYLNGVINVETNVALEQGVELFAEFEVDIELNPSLIPLIDHTMQSCILRPSQSAIAADASIQSMFTMTREYGLDIKSMQMSHLRNYLADEKAKSHLRDMYWHTQKQETFNIYCPTGEDWKLHRELLREVLHGLSQKILEATKVSGLVGMFAGVYASKIFKSLGAPYFEAAPNYRQSNQVHYAGKLFGIWRVYESPVILEADEVLCYGRGNSHSEAGFVAGEAIAPTMYNHDIGPNLKSRNTLWSLSYNDIHPFDGEQYFYKLRIINSPEAQRK
ncbi:hypothetical protein [Thaumasiovibrio sp. DFM-14]|uniref:hypothetical protein n=1 Tax=Thaumasiovibrio sp. DFM-14 TaxID=3384792 RepID=UPI0039A3AF97